MAVENLTSPRSSLPNVYTNVTAREEELALRFENNWEALSNVMGIMRPIRKQPGTVLKRYNTKVTLENGKINPGAVIPYSKATFEQVAIEEISLEKYSTAATLEDIVEYGADIALDKANTAFLAELQNRVLTTYYTFLNDVSGLTDTAATWQAALAKAKGLVLDKFNKLRKTVTDVVGFANVLDAYEYLGDKDVTIQNEWGISYIKNFLGYTTVFLLSDPDIPEGTVFAVPVENINLYYVDPQDSNIQQGDLVYTTAGTETNLIGIHIKGDYDTAVSATYAIMGLTLWSEIEDGIAKITITTPTP